MLRALTKIVQDSLLSIAPYLECPEGYCKEGDWEYQSESPDESDLCFDANQIYVAPDRTAIERACTN